MTAKPAAAAMRDCRRSKVQNSVAPSSKARATCRISNERGFDLPPLFEKQDEIISFPHQRFRRGFDFIDDGISGTHGRKLARREWVFKTAVLDRRAMMKMKESGERVRWNRNGSMVGGLEELGVRQAGGGFLEGDEGQAGGGGLGVDQAVEESRLGSGKSLGREQWE
jgi:hypothetical protein